MTKANLQLKDGTKLYIVGSPEEIIKIKQLLDEEKCNKNISQNDKNGIFSKKGPISRITDLIGSGFFDEKKTLNDIKKALEEKAVFYSSQSLSPALVRLTHRGTLRRIKEKGMWRYVNP